MSSAVRERLLEIGARGETRRGRTLQIRRESLALCTIMRELVQSRQRPQIRTIPPDSSVRPPCDTNGLETSVLGQVRDLFSGDVIDQVGRLLHEVDAQEQEQWTQEDAEVLRAAQSLWAAAARKGYSIDDLEAVLRALHPRTE